MDIWYIYFSLSALINAVISAFFGLFIYIKNREAKANKIFILFCFGVAAWSFPYIFWPLAKTPENTLMAFQLLHVGACYVSILYFHFVVEWLGMFEKMKKVVYFGYFIASFFVLIIPTSLFIYDMVPKFSMRYWAEPGILYHFYLVMFFSYFFYSSYLLIKSFIRATGVKRCQIKYILIGMVLAFLGGSTNYFLWYDINFPPYGNILASSFVIFTAYAIIKYRLMDIRLVIKRSFVFTFMIVITTAIFVIGAFLSLRYLDDPFTGRSLVLGSILVSAILVFGFQPLKNFLQRVTDQFLFLKDYEPQKFLSETGDYLSATLEPNKLFQIIITRLDSIFHYKSASILLLSQGNKQYNTVKCFGESKKLCSSFTENDPLVKFLSKRKNVIVTEEALRRYGQIEGDVSLPKYLLNMQESGASIIIPLFTEKVLIGLSVSSLITATMLLESTPPLRKAPRGTSDMSLRFTDLQNES